MPNEEVLPVGKGLQPDEHARYKRYGHVWRMRATDLWKMDVCQSCRCMFPAHERKLFYGSNLRTGHGVCMDCLRGGKAAKAQGQSPKAKVEDALDDTGWSEGALAAKLKIKRPFVKQELLRLKGERKARLAGGLWYPLSAPKAEPKKEGLF